MPHFVNRANVDHYLEVLHDPSLPSEKRATVVKLLIAEEDTLSRYHEQLEFAEIRLAKSRDRVNHIRNLRGRFADGSDERVIADRVLENMKTLHQLLDHFCHRMRSQVKSRGI